MKNRFYTLLSCLAVVLTMQHSLAQMGWLDNTWNTNGVLSTVNVVSYTKIDVCVQADGKVLVLGRPSSTGYYKVYRYESDGSPDLSFGVNGEVSVEIGEPRAVRVQSNGKIVVLGRYEVSRLEVNGVLDPTFGTGGTVMLPNSPITGVEYDGEVMELRSDGKVVIGMQSGTMDPVTFLLIEDAAILQLNSDGTTYSLTSTPTLEFIDIHDIVIQSDDKAVLIGEGQALLITSGNFLFRINTNGTPDTGYGPTNNGIHHFDLFGPHRAAVVQPDNKILVAVGGGDIHRYDTDGSFDNTFGVNGVVNTGLGFVSMSFANGCSHILIDNNNKIVLSAETGLSGFTFARFYADGTYDNSFGGDGVVNVGLGSLLYDDIDAMALQSTGEYLAVGQMNNALTVLRIGNCAPGQFAEYTTVCDGQPFTWIDGNTYSSDTIVTYTMSEAAWNGCDSLITLYLSFPAPGSLSSTDTQVSCGPFTWIDGNTYTANNNTATWILPAQSGCDSTVTLDLTINSVNVGTSTAGLTITADEPNASYQWIDCNTGNAITGATAQSYTASTNGLYAVVVTNNNCTDTSACVTINTIGIQDVSEKMVHVAPNPTNGIISVSLTGVSGTSTYRLMDMRGRVLYEGIAGETHFELDLSGKDTGIYLLHLSSGEGESVTRISKQ